MAADQAPADHLLGADDPPPFEILNDGADGAVLLVCDHASNRIPRALGRLGLDEADLHRHIAIDIGAGDVTRGLAERLGTPAVIAGYSRLVIDNNRYRADPTSIPEISDGTIVPGNRNLDSTAIRLREAELFDPYHDEIARRLVAMETPERAAALVSIHSFTPFFRGAERPWHVGLLWNRDGRIVKPLLAALRANRGIIADENVPYSARDPYGYTNATHADATGRPNVLIEIRQDLIDTRQGVADWVDILSAALAEVMADPVLFRRVTPT